MLEDLVGAALRDRSRDDPWRAKAVGRLAWEYLVRSDYPRAELYLKELPVAYQRYPRGLVALRRISRRSRAGCSGGSPRRGSRSGARGV